MIKKNSEKKKKNSENQDYGDFFNMIRFQKPLEDVILSRENPRYIPVPIGGLIYTTNKKKAQEV